MVLLGHSMGCKVAHYFLNWVLRHGAFPRTPPAAHPSSGSGSSANTPPRQSLSRSDQRPAEAAVLSGAEREAQARLWIAEHVHTFLAVGGPFLGAFKALRAQLSGEVSWPGCTVAWLWARR